MVKVLFVCLGNICRSPTAEGVFRKLVSDNGIADDIYIDSAGTHAYHTNQPPDLRAQEAAAARGIDLTMLRGRRATKQDIIEFDYVLAMDRDNYEDLSAIAGAVTNKISLFMDYSQNYEEHYVPDPYYGGIHGFERVLDMIEDAAQGLLIQIRERYTI